MTTRELIESVEKRGIRLWLDGSRLRFHGPATAVTPDVIALLRERKAEVIRQLGEPREYRLSHGQHALWFVYQSPSAPSAYNLAFCGRLRSRVDPDSLRRSLGTLIDRHAILRTTYKVRDGEPLQVIHPAMATDFETVELAGASLDEIRERATRDCHAAFPLEQGPMLRGRLYTRAARDHVLLLALPHIAADGWSLWHLIDELRQLYPAALEGRTDVLPPAVHQYVDFARWQEELLAGPEGMRLAEYWERTLERAPEKLELPGDHVAPAAFRFSGDMLQFGLGRELSARIRSFARKSGVTLHTLILALYQILLHRYSGQNRILLGTPTTGRTRAEFAQVVGCFVNTVIIPADFSADPTFREFLVTAREAALEAIAHQEYPLALIARRTRSSNPGLTSVFQADFVLQKPQRSSDVLNMFQADDHQGRIEFAGMGLEPFPILQQAGQLDLTLEMIDAPDEILGDLKYHRDRFERSTIERMIGHFRTLVESALANPDMRISELPLLSTGEREDMLDRGRGAETPPAAGTLVDRIAEWMERIPDATSVVIPGPGERRTLSYGRLSADADAVAAAIDDARGDGARVVAYCMVPSERSVACVLGTWRAGCAVLPIDPGQPRERIAQILDEARPSIILCEAGTAGHLPAAAARVLVWEDLPDEHGVRSGAAPEPDDAAYIIFTSGSTGRPKGVVVSHGNLLNALIGWETGYGLRQGDVHLQMASPGFDVWMGDLARALGTGGTLVVLPREWLLVPDRLAHVIESERVGVAEFVPAVLRVLRDQTGPADERLQSLRLVACGSDQWYQREIRGIRAILPANCRLVNSYGITEATIDSSYFDVVAADVANGDRQVPIGRPFANIRMHVLDRHLQPVPLNVVGELCIGGSGVTPGYLNRPDLDGDRFVPDPYSDQRGARLYRTGDLARLRPDGQFELVGRGDDQVKIRGNRVELGDIEACFNEYPTIRAAVAVYERNGDDSGGRLGVFVVPETADEVSVDALLDFARGRLPAYMVPGIVKVIDSIPLNANGKVNRKALPPLGQDGAGAVDRTAPRTATEETLIRIWQELLETDAGFGVHSDFFQLGGHSLLATRLMWRVGEELNVTIASHILFEASTVAELALRVDAARLSSALVASDISQSAAETIEF